MACALAQSTSRLNHQQRLSRRLVAQASAQSMERDDCDLRTEYGLLNERPVINGIRGEEVTEMRSSIRLDAEDICQGPSVPVGQLWCTGQDQGARAPAPPRPRVYTLRLWTACLADPLQIRTTLTKAKEAECTSSSKVYHCRAATARRQTSPSPPPARSSGRQLPHTWCGT